MYVHKKKNKIVVWCTTSSIKRELREFYVLVVQ